MMTEEDYPYEMRDAECRYDANRIEVTPADMFKMSEPTEDELA